MIQCVGRRHVADMAVAASTEIATAIFSFATKISCEESGIESEKLKTIHVLSAGNG
jgi:hypothetical protein